MVRTSACHAEGREFESRRSRHSFGRLRGRPFLLMMMKILLVLLFLLYRLVIELVYCFAYPLIWMGLGAKHYREALRVGQGKTDILIHAASLGEINALSSLIRALAESGFTLHLNTITVTGRERAKQLFPKLTVSLSPLDVPHLKQAQMRALRPRLILIAETEIWPNMLYAARKQNIPIVFINARISPKTLDFYLKIRSLMTLWGGTVKKVLAQSEADAQRFNALFPGKAEFAGNLKFAIELPSFSQQELRKQWFYTDEDSILCWGSSRPGEEELIIKAYPHLRKAHPNLKLILAPRHPKRVREVESLLREMDYVLHSQLSGRHDVVVIDSLGRLAECYALCDVAVIGGSFFDFGGHNPLEPAFYAKAIIIGNYYSSCKDSVHILQQSRGIMVSSKETLMEDISLLLADHQLRADMGENAKKVLTENAAALKNHIEEIKKCLC